jgi:hypothetical protein
MEILTDAKLIAAVEAFIDEHDQMSASRFGRETMNDPDLLRQMKAGRSLSLKNAEKILLFIEKHRNARKPRKAAA